MYKIKQISFLHHPVLENLTLDFCDSNGNCVDTIILAGENGTGKSTIINAIYMLVSRTADFEADVVFDKDGKVFTMCYRYKEVKGFGNQMYVSDGSGMNVHMNSDDFSNRHSMAGIYSDIDINFHAQQLSTVTSLELDCEHKSRKSSNDLPTQINQLLIDIQALDDAEIAYAAKNNPHHSYAELKVNERIPRFTHAFNKIFENLTYSRVINEKGKKSILFQKDGKDIPIQTLSSGEKQIVYRGCFLLKDANAMNGTFVFIDEPEISLHPKWQQKILDYYKSIFTNEAGIQTSQIFVVTHSPFIIHNPQRKNDKVIVLGRDKDGCISVKDKPEYYKCTSIEAIEDAFSIPNFSSDIPTVYLEGRTDEKYFNKALEIFGYKIPFQFKWVGYMKAGDKEEFTGKDSLNKAFQFLAGRNLPIKNVCLFDCDTNRSEREENQVYVRVINTYENAKGIKAGIENALVLDDIDLTQYYKVKEQTGDYGEKKRIEEFQKMTFCNDICAMDEVRLRKILANLKVEIDKLQEIFLEKEVWQVT